MEVLRGQIENSSHPAHAILITRLNLIAKSEAVQINQAGLTPPTLAATPCPVPPARVALIECYILLQSGASLQQLAAAVKRFAKLCDSGGGYIDSGDPFTNEQTGEHTNACSELLDEINWRDYLEPDMEGQLPQKRHHESHGRHAYPPCKPNACMEFEFDFHEGA